MSSSSPTTEIQSDAIVSNLESILDQIEFHGGVHEEGRQALERLKAVLEHKGCSSEDVPVMQQMDDIRRHLSALERKVSNMSDDIQAIVSVAGGDAIQSMLHIKRDGQVNTTATGKQRM